MGNVCTPAGYGLTLTQGIGNQLSLSFVVTGEAFTGTSASGETDITAIFTTQIAGTDGTITSFLTAAAAGGVPETYSATITAGASTVPSTIPEPSSLVMLVTGLLGGGFLKMRRR